MHEIAQTVGPDDVVFDIGANLGDKSAWFLGRGARVVCVEPQPALIAHLKSRFAGEQNISVVGKGVGDTPGILTMSINRAAPVLSTFSQVWKSGRFSGQVWDDAVEVEITTLDALIKEYGNPTYTKIDVEGFEKNVVRGLSTKTGTLSVEFTGEFIKEAVEIAHLLHDRGYDLFNISLGESDTFSNESWLAMDEICTLIIQLASESDAVWGDLYAR